ncbi:hypothetical protein Patl1_28575 [Pistacia atlantica]|uniref:Uncharacterized protein n=1 Tax=Pistacia atlantica TaxID=434234 RepID=A0ACC1BDB5_9ROSI|nr:hypothetical protein Patl1_28575 [Pistacia atlantica]
MICDILSVCLSFVFQLMRPRNQLDNGCAFLALGRKEDALSVWEKGYEHALYSRPSVPTSGSGTYVNGKTGETNENLDKSEIDEKCENLNKSDSSSSSYQPSDTPEICSKSRDNTDICNDMSDKASGRLSMPELELGLHSNGKSIETSKNRNGLNDESEIIYVSSDSPDEFDICNGFSDKANANEKLNGQMNGTHDKPRSDSESFKELKTTTISRGKSPLSCISTSETSDEAKRNKKFSVTRISKTKSISVDFRLSRGIAQVNEGKYAYAVSIFDQILKENPMYPEALIGRGTAYAFQRELEAAIADFTKAIQSNPSAGEAWKRRGQARAALGESVEGKMIIYVCKTFIKAIEDLTKALEFEPNSADILHERGIVNFKFKDYSAAVRDLSECVKLDMDNKSAYTYWGLALSMIGEYKKAEETHLKAIQLDRNFLEGWGHMTTFYQDLANSTKALECLQQMLQIDERFPKAYHLRGLLLHGMGQHRKAVKDLSTGLSIEPSNIECLYLRASCYHATGQYREAVKDYDAALDLELDSMEKFKEIALYTASKINSEFCWFDIDGDIDPLFKKRRSRRYVCPSMCVRDRELLTHVVPSVWNSQEYWCKRLHPKNVCEKVYRQPPLRDSLKKGKLRKQDFAVTKQKTALLLAADSIGKKIQYDVPGFLSNRRQHRMAGLAAIEIAQKVSKVWRSLRAERKHSNKSSTKNGKRARRKDRINIASQNRGGACCSTSSMLDTSSYGIAEERPSGPTMSWQDVYSVAVRWRQISEPCDPVVWVNKLSEEFNSGFGSHTPMILGQAKVARYFSNYERTINVAKTVMKDKQYVHNKTDGIIDLSKDGKLQDIMHAKTCDDLYKVVGEDFWLATWCNSTAFEGKQLEGTRITLVKMGEIGYDFAIRTPCTPSRWDEFDGEMTMAWEWTTEYLDVIRCLEVLDPIIESFVTGSSAEIAVCNAYCGDNYGSTDFSVLENVRDAILRMTYYWYNFMPLSRGSAAVGFVVLLGLFLAANMEFSGQIPKGVQVDWEAILNFEPNAFVDSVKSWLYPSLKVSTSWKDYPDVSSTFATTGSVVAALSSYDD